MINEYENLGIDQISNLTIRLKRVNSRMKNLLQRLPLSDFREVAELSKLAKEQKDLLERSVRKGPPREMALLEKERDSALFLSSRYNRELNNGNIRKSSF